MFLHRLPVLIVALAVLAFGAAPVGRAGPDPVVVGVVLPMSGDNATFGEESWNGIKIAEGSFESVATDPRVVEAYLGTGGMARK